jgi:hypothetical protein
LLVVAAVREVTAVVAVLAVILRLHLSLLVHHLQ